MEGIERLDFRPASDCVVRACTGRQHMFARTASSPYGNCTECLKTYVPPEVAEYMRFIASMQNKTVAEVLRDMAAVYSMSEEHAQRIRDAYYDGRPQVRPKLAQRWVEYAKSVGKSVPRLTVVR